MRQLSQHIKRKLAVYIVILIDGNNLFQQLYLIQNCKTLFFILLVLQHFFKILFANTYSMKACTQNMLIVMFHK